MQSSPTVFPRHPTLNLTVMRMENWRETAPLTTFPIRYVNTGKANTYIPAIWPWPEIPRLDFRHSTILPAGSFYLGCGLATCSVPYCGRQLPEDALLLDFTFNAARYIVYAAPIHRNFHARPLAKLLPHIRALNWHEKATLHWNILDSLLSSMNLYCTPLVMESIPRVEKAYRNYADLLARNPEQFSNILTILRHGKTA